VGGAQCEIEVHRSMEHRSSWLKTEAMQIAVSLCYTLAVSAAMCASQAVELMGKQSWHFFIIVCKWE